MGPNVPFENKISGDVLKKTIGKAVRNSIYIKFQWVFDIKAFNFTYNIQLYTKSIFWCNLPQNRLYLTPQPTIARNPTDKALIRRIEADVGTNLPSQRCCTVWKNIKN